METRASRKDRITIGKLILAGISINAAWMAMVGAGIVGLLVKTGHKDEEVGKARTGNFPPPNQDTYPIRQPESMRNAG